MPSSTVEKNVRAREVDVEPTTSSHWLTLSFSYLIVTSSAQVDYAYGLPKRARQVCAHRHCAQRHDEAGLSHRSPNTITQSHSQYQLPVPALTCGLTCAAVLQSGQDDHHRAGDDRQRGPDGRPTDTRHRLGERPAQRVHRGSRERHARAWYGDAPLTRSAAESGAQQQPLPDGAVG